ncbi:redox-regulated ATPase YchF [Candidatus Parcubacteria bacterium]|nr:redox-regulated ATPase YchF [Candidatus Parcubacteria bacterium]
MALSIGIVGLPNVGKSTLFNGLTKKSVEAANYPFCTIDPSVGVVAVPDDRLYKLADFSKTKKTIPAAVEFVDIAGLVKGASEGEGLGNKFLSNIRETDAILEVVRIFEDDNIIHVDGKIHPKNDIEVINLELILADLESVRKQRDSVARDAKRGDKEAVIKEALLARFQEALEAEKLANTVSLTDAEKPLAKTFNLLTVKPILYALNKKAGGKNLDEMGDERYAELLKYIESLGADYVLMDAKVQEDLKDFSDEEKAQFASELGHEDGIDKLIRKSYQILNLITYFTTGEEETRAWTVLRGTDAKHAGGAIHTDFIDKFIRAEIIHWDTLLDAGSYAAAREKGAVRTEGKDYIVKDGDVVEFKI